MNHTPEKTDRGNEPWEPKIRRQERAIENQYAREQSDFTAVSLDRLLGDSLPNAPQIIESKSELLNQIRTLEGTIDDMRTNKIKILDNHAKLLREVSNSRKDADFIIKEIFEPFQELIGMYNRDVPYPSEESLQTIQDCTAKLVLVGNRISERERKERRSGTPPPWNSTEEDIFRRRPILGNRILTPIREDE